MSAPACHPLIAGHEDRYQAWCKPCRWFDAQWRDYYWQALLDLQDHQGSTPEPAPTWARGPGR